jgi:peptidoglycan/xylan/chitin deacetylase (PgdA/CDA1 family)
MVFTAGHMRRGPSWILGVGLFVGIAQAESCDRPLYLTFDVGNMRHAEHIAKILEAEQVPATFFLANNVTMRGDRALDEAWRSYWRGLASQGHVFGNHTWSHLYARKDAQGSVTVYDRSGKTYSLDQVQYCNELNQVDRAFRQLTGTGLSPIWRAPGGRTTPATLRWARECGYPTHIAWSEAGLVGDELPSDKYPNDVLVRRAIDRLRSGDIILMHLGIRSRQQPLAESLQPMIRALKDKGFCFRTVEPGVRHD